MFHRSLSYAKGANSNKINAQSVQNLINFAYLFITDPIKSAKCQYNSYVYREPGYGRATLMAYNSVFAKTERELSAELILEIHKIALAHLPKANAGKFRKNHVQFELLLHFGDSNKFIHFNTTETGLKELITKYFVNDELKLNRFLFKNRKDPSAHMYLIHSLKDKSFVFNIYDVTSKLIKTQPIDANALYDTVKDLMIDPEYGCNYIMHSHGEQIESERLNKFVSLYNNEIANANTDDDKIRAIINLVQSIDQNHLFIDGNIRTCMILMNYLLSQNGLPLTLLFNPNWLDGFSVNELVEAVKNGQKLYKDVLANDGKQTINLIFTDTITDDYESIDIEMTVPLQPFKIPDIDEEVVNEFANKVSQISIKHTENLNATNAGPSIGLAHFKK